MRLDPLSIPYRAGESVVRLAWVLVIIAIGSPTVEGVSGMGLLVVAWFVVALTYQLVYYQRFEYELTEDTLDIASGVVSRRNREIPVRRVQNVDISRNVVQRALGIAQINLETAGGSSTEAALKYVSLAEANRLQDEIGRLKRGAAVGDEPAEPERELFSMTRRELGLLGLVGIDLRLLSFVGVLLPVAFPWVRDQLTDPGSTGPILQDPWLVLLLSAPILAVAIITATALLSGVLAVANYYGFRLTRRSDELHYERGLLKRYSGTIPLEKVQALTVSENVIARRIGYASLAVETAGYAPGESGSESAVPLAERRRVVDLARSVEPFEDVEFQRPPKRARERYLVRYTAIATLAVAAAFAVDRFTGFTFSWWAAGVLLLAAPVGAHLKWANLGYELQPEYAIFREGFWTRTTTVVPYYRVQTVIDSQTVFQRGRRLATLVVDTAGSSGLTGRNPRALDVDEDVAARMREDVESRLQETLARRREQRRRERLQSIEAEAFTGSPGATD